MEIAEPVKRRVERVQFFEPLHARFGAAAVAMSDLTLEGAGIQHHAQIPRGENHPLRFCWQEQDVTINSRVVRTRLECYRFGGASLTLYRSGLNFVEPTAEQTVLLRKIIAGKVARALEEQHLNAYAVTREDVPLSLGAFADPKPSLNLNDLFMSAVQTRGYFRCVFEAGRWTRTWTDSPEQPELGFTVHAGEGDDGVKLLCRTFEQADSHGRALIRMIAKLSVTEPSDVPRDRFRP